MRRIGVRFGTLLAVCAVAPLAMSVSPASATSINCRERIFGAGSSLQKIAQREVWITGGRAAFGSTGNLWSTLSLCLQLPGIEYYSSSSGKGMGQWGNNTRTELLLEELENKSGTREKIFPTYVGTDAAPEGKTSLGSVVSAELLRMDNAGGQSTLLGSGVVVVPVAQSAVTVMVSLPAGCTLRVRTAPKVSVLGLYEEWTHKTNGVRGVEWAKLIEGGEVVNKGTERCGATSVLRGKVGTTFARSAASGTTAGFKRFFKALRSRKPADERAWTEKTETVAKALSASEWPAGTGQEERGLVGGRSVELEKGSQEAEATYENANSIGYADLADALKAKFPTGTRVVEHTANGNNYTSFLVEVSNGTFTELPTQYASPETEEGESNCSGVTYEPLPTAVEGNADWSHVVENSQERGRSGNYPICTLTYDLAWHIYDKVRGPLTYKEEQVNAVYAFLHYIVSEREGQLELGSRHYGKLPASVRRLAESGLAKQPGEAGAAINWL